MLITPKSFRLNTVFNLIGGGLMLLYALLLPGILSRAMSPDAFGAYILGVQFVPFLFLLATPIQQSLAPRFANLNTEGSDQASIELFWIAIRVLSVASLVAVVVSLAASKLLPVILGWPDKFGATAASSIALLGSAAALSFPVFAVTSFAAGRQNFLWDNLLKCAGPYVGLFLVTMWTLLSAQNSTTIEPQQLIYLFASANVTAACLVGVFGVRRISLKIKVSGSALSGTAWTHLGAARGVLWWQLCALLSMSVAPFIVSSVEPEKVAAFSVTVSLMSLIAGLTGALAGPFSVRMGQYAASDAKNRTNIFLKLQRPFQAFLLSATALLILLPLPVFELWVGKTLAQQIFPLIVPLALANLIRQTTGPYTTALLGLGLQNKLWLSPAAEAAGSVLFGLLLGMYYGAIGVAYGILVASSLRLLLTALHDLPATRFALDLSLMDLIFPYRADTLK